MKKFPGWVSVCFSFLSFRSCFLLLWCHHIAIALWYIVGRILNMCFAHMLPPRPRNGFSRLLFYFHAQFSLRNISISFRDGFSRLLFCFHAHSVGFLAFFDSSAPSFRYWLLDCMISFWIGFSTYPSLGTPKT